RPAGAPLVDRRGLWSLLMPTPLPHPTVAPARSTGYRPPAPLLSPRGKGRLALRSPRVLGANRRATGSGGRATATSPSSVMSTAGASSGKNRIVLGVFDTADPLSLLCRGDDRASAATREWRTGWTSLSDRQGRTCAMASERPL